MRPLTLLTGAGGYLGKNLAPFLRSKLTLKEHFRTKAQLNIGYPGSTFGDLHKSDVLKSIVTGVDCIVHAAALIPSNQKKLNSRDFLASNFETTTNLAQAAIDANVERFVYISTVNLYNFENVDADELSATGNFALHHEYLQSKLEAERELIRLFNHRRNDLMILRIGTPFGGAEPSDKLIPYMINRALHNEDLVLTASRNTQLNYIYMPDLVRSIYFLLKTRQSGIFNITTSFLLETLAKTIITQSHSSSKLLYPVENSDRVAISFPSISCRKFQDLAKQEFMDLNDSISDYIQKLRKE